MSARGSVKGEAETDLKKLPAGLKQLGQDGGKVGKTGKYQAWNNRQKGGGKSDPCDKPRKTYNQGQTRGDARYGRTEKET